MGGHRAARPSARTLRLFRELLRLLVQPVWGDQGNYHPLGAEGKICYGERCVRVLRLILPRMIQIKDEEESMFVKPCI